MSRPREQVDRVGREGRDDDVGAAGAVVLGRGEGIGTVAPDGDRRPGSARAGCVDDVERGPFGRCSVDGGVQRIAHRVSQLDQLSSAGPTTGAAAASGHSVGEPVEPRVGRRRVCEPVEHVPVHRVEGVVQLDRDRLLPQRPWIRDAHPLMLVQLDNR